MRVKSSNASTRTPRYGEARDLRYRRNFNRDILDRGVPDVWRCPDDYDGSMGGQLYVVISQLPNRHSLCPNGMMDGMGWDVWHGITIAEDLHQHSDSHFRVSFRSSVHHIDYQRFAFVNKRGSLTCDWNPIERLCYVSSVGSQVSIYKSLGWGGVSCSDNLPGAMERPLHPSATHGHETDCSMCTRDRVNADGWRPRHLFSLLALLNGRMGRGQEREVGNLGGEG